MDSCTISREDNTAPGRSWKLRLDLNVCTFKHSFCFLAPQLLWIIMLFHFPVCFKLIWSPTNSQTYFLLTVLMQKSAALSSVQSLSCVQLCDPTDCSTPGLPVYHQLPEFTQTHVHHVGDAIQQFHPLLFLPSIFPSIKVFSNESVLHIGWPKYWSFSFNISLSN